MGSHISKIKEQNAVNYHCPVCKSSNKIPNLVGKFILVNEHNFKCNGCNHTFNANIIHSSFINKKPITLKHAIKV